MKMLALAVLCSWCAAGAASASDLGPLEKRVAAVVAESRSTVGVGLRDLTSGETVLVRGREHFPMFSVYKLPIAMRVLQRVDEGALRLADPVAIEPKDVRPGSSTAVTSRLQHGRGTLSIAELVEAAVAQSDNTASDLILRLAGGPAAVTAYVRSLGIEGLRVDRPEVQMAADTYGVTLPASWEAGELPALLTAPPAQRRAAIERYVADPRDSVTPEAALALLARVARRDALKPPSADYVLRTLEKTTTGPGRIRGLLPKGTVVANKTGSGPTAQGYTAASNDIGLLTLTSGRQIAVAVFVSASAADDAARDRTIAEIARAAYDHWSR
jgi:beta-lactamase class A